MLLLTIYVPGSGVKPSLNINCGQTTCVKIQSKKIACSTCHRKPISQVARMLPKPGVKIVSRQSVP